MSRIKEGDQVRHKTKIINGGLTMSVLDVSDNQALCEHFEGPKLINKQTWFDISDLDIVIHGEGGFKNPGE